MSKVAFITGSAQGIGAGIALRLAKDGFDIAIADLPKQAGKAEEIVLGIESIGRRSFFIPLDVTVQAEVFAAVDKVVAKLGSLDVMVNNAGVAKIDAVVDIDPEDLELSYKVNVFGVIYGIQAAAKKMKELGIQGKIISASSTAGRKAFPIWGTYSSTKAAVRSITQAAAAELAADGIKVNAYAPGAVGTTGMWEEVNEKMNRLNGKENIRDFVGKIPLGRRVAPDDVVKLVAFLAGPESDFITGQSLVVDGGAML